MEAIEIYTDGACSGNPGKGGFGIVIKYKQHRKELCAGFRKTTNNRMELLAVIIGLEQLKDPTLPVKIYSDSRYVVDAVNNKYVFAWRRNGFVNRPNADLWQRLLKVYDYRKHEFIWVKGHADNVENNRCDQIAVMAAQAKDLQFDLGFESDKPSELF
jgi:ribonuclease HI